MKDVREIETAPVTREQAEQAVAEFWKKFDAEGDHLRMESVTNLCGKRLVLVFDWDDMG